VLRKGEGESLLAEGKTAEIAEMCGIFHLLSKAEGFDIGDDAPAVQRIKGGGKGRLLAFRNAIADLFEKGPFRKRLNLDTSQVCGKRMKTLAHRRIALIVLTMTLGAELGIENLAHLDLRGVGQGNGRFQPVRRNGLKNFLSALMGNGSRRHGKWHFLVRSYGRGLPHSAKGEILIIIDQRLVSHEADDGQSDENDQIFFHLFAFLTFHVLRVRQWFINRIGRFTGHILHRSVVPGRLALIPHDKERKKPFYQDDGQEKKDHHPGGKR